MYKNYLFYITLLFFSCADTKDSNIKNSEFIQPKVLEKHSEFNIDALNFNEDVSLLFSKSLDTINNEYSLKKLELARYPSLEKIEREENESYKGFAIMPEERYFLQSLVLDSIATLNGIYFNRVDIETNKDLKIKTFLAYTNFYTTKELDSALSKLYVKYGNTEVMKEQERIDVEYDSLRGKTRSTPKSYEKYLYEYGQDDYAYTGKYHYNEWVLNDRVFQIKIYEGRDIEVDLNSGEILEKDFHTVEFLYIRKEEYDVIKRILFKKMGEYEHGLEILKPYKIKSLNYESEYYKYTEEMDRIKEAEMEAEYLRSLEKE